MLTLEQLYAMPPDTAFARGETIDSPEGVNMTNSGRQLRWVAERGGIHDWAIYIHHAEHSFDYVKCHGDKVHSENHVRKLVPCDDASFKMYRH